MVSTAINHGRGRVIKRFASLFLPGKQRRRAEGVRIKRQGDVYLSQDRFLEAADCYRRALTVDARFLEACIGLGFVLAELRQYPEARQHLQQALLIDTGNADAHYILGTIHHFEEDFPGAIAHFSQASDSNPLLELAHRRLIDALLVVGETDRAQACIERALACFPDRAEFWFDIANLHARTSNWDQAVNCYQKALAIAPRSLAAHINLANVLMDAGQLQPAIESYRRALAVQPDSFEAVSGLGLAYERMKSLTVAIACFEQAAEIQPGDPLTQLRLGATHEAQGNLDASIDCYRKAVILKQDYILAHQGLGNALLAKGHIPDAIASFQAVVRLEPDSPINHLVDALSGRVSDSPPPAYVEQLFDEYADKFESHLVRELKYSVPEQLVALLRGIDRPDSRKWSVLDLGCGTGLLGAEVAPLANRLVGVDLSSKMLAKAGALNLYDRLVQMDLLEMMKDEAAESYDLVAAADVFVYVGKLDALFAEARRVLSPCGLLAFSVESLDALESTVAVDESTSYRLNPTGRYAHSMRYLKGLAVKCDFEIVIANAMQSRIDKGVPVVGYLLILRCNWQSARGMLQVSDALTL